ncbi:hypothetical protein [Acinetobacter defluvii]|uniref:hypothetical protein n=1 Tax=Acinetobacter defluvii TaxID=1871111 RepID=UPI003AF54C09
MSLKEYCEKCKGKLTTEITDHLSGLYCENCQQWAVVTTYIPPIQLDEQLYKIYLRDNDKVDHSIIKLIATILNINFIEAKRLLSTFNPMIHEEKAVKTYRVIQTLNEAQLKFICIPEFPWN